MKRISYIILSLLAVVFLSFSCVKNFLEKPDTSGNIDLDKVYSSSVTAEQALASAYRDALSHGWPGSWGVWHGALASISGERIRGWSWHATYEISESGLKVSNILNQKDSGSAGADSFTDNWAAVRAAYVVKENIHRVPDMEPFMKEYIKAEATALVAYRYMGMFYRYGGVPIVRRSFLPDDNYFLNRAPLKETLDFILELCEEAYNGLPDAWEAKYTGRMTKGAVLAIKARALQFAARPLFNSATPYLSGAETDALVCFGDEDRSRWQDAIDAHEDVLSWASSNGYAIISTGGSPGTANPNAIDDYGAAVSLPGNREVLLAYKIDDGNNDRGNIIALYNNTSAYWGEPRFETENCGLPTNFLENYYLADGSDPQWPKAGDASPTPGAVWVNNMANIEPRFRADWVVPFVNPECNPGDNNWSLEGWYRSPGNVFNGNTFPRAGDQGKGAGTTAKFYYKAGGRTWFEPPLFRLAETYLSLAEAYNETGNSAKALENLNMVHNRAGLPSVTETDQDKLRELIWREKAIEFYAENHRYYDVKHWKHPGIDQGIIGGPIRELQFRGDTSAKPDMYLPGHLSAFWDVVTYVSFWHPKMYLEPIPQVEVNKGYITQNPGY